MKTNPAQPVLFTLIGSGLLFALTACSLATTPPSAAARSEPAAKVEEIHATDSASQCSAVHEAVAHGTCHQQAFADHHGGMCQPQSIPYARCRSHISSCNLGNTSPVQLFLCEQQRGYTSAIPKPGMLMSIGVNHQHHMPTGHTLYVDEVCPNPDGTYKLRVSHTNYDRRCHLEENAWVHYDPRSMHADFDTGHWSAWGKRLPVQGFIGHEPGDPAAVPLTPTTGQSVVPQRKPTKKPARSTAKSARRR